MIRLLLRSSNRLCQKCRISQQRYVSNKTRENQPKNKEFDETDFFGSLSQRGNQALSVMKVERYYGDDPDNYDVEEFDIIARKNYYYYDREISKYSRQGRNGIRKALQLFHDMKSKDRLTPRCHDFSPLIYGCSLAGYTKKAFDLYKESLKYQKKPTKSVVTALINACAESPFKDYALKKLEWFREHLRLEYNYQLNEIHYRSLIKAYGKLGKLENVNEIIKLMIADGFNPDTITMNNILLACSYDKEVGLTMALRVFKRMRLYDIKPDSYSYSIILNCIRTCGFGSQNLLTNTLKELPATTNFNQELEVKSRNRNRKASMREQLKQDFAWIPPMGDMTDYLTKAIDKSGLESKEDEKNLLALEAGSGEANLVQISNHCDKELPTLVTKDTFNLPNLLSDDHSDQLSRIEAIDFSKLNRARNKILLFGGMAGYLDLMKKTKCDINIKIFTAILRCIKPTRNNITEYLRLTNEYKLKKDLVFYDNLIEVICSDFTDRTRLARGLVIFDEMQKNLIKPNVTSFQKLALGCDTWKMAKRLLNDLEQTGFTVTPQLITSLYNVAIKHQDITYLIHLMKYSRDTGFQPSKYLVDKLECLRLSERKYILDYEKGINLNEIPERVDEDYIKSYDIFSKSLGLWLNNTEIYEEDHPWKQYYFDERSKSSGFSDFVEDFKKLSKIKREKIKLGIPLGNLAAEAGIMDGQKDRIKLNG